MQINCATLFWLASAVVPAISAPTNGGNSGGGWYVVNESLACINTCAQLQNCVITGAPSDSDIDNFCRQITDDCADGQLSRGDRAVTYIAGAGILATAGLTTDGNRGCPNNNDCQLSVKYLLNNMRYPSAAGHPNTDCFQASIQLNGYYNHAKIGVLALTLPTVKIVPPKERRAGKCYRSAFKIDD